MANSDVPAHTKYPGSWVRTLFDPNDACHVINMRKRNLRGSMRATNGVFWRAMLEGKSFNKACEVVFNEFNVPSLDKVKSDMAAFMEGLPTENGLLSTKPGKSHFELVSWPDGAPQVDMVDEAVLDRGLLRYRLLCYALWLPVWVLSRVRWDILERILLVLRWLRPVASPNRTKKLVASARYAGRRNPARNFCLETSLQVFFVGWLTGSVPRVCIGTGFPINFHSWVEDSLGNRVGEPPHVELFGAVFRA